MQIPKSSRKSKSPDKKSGFSFKAKPWKYEGKGGWYFLTLPTSVAQKIRRQFQNLEEGWGRLRVIAQINNLKWQTSIWFDRKAKSYLLPLKSEIRTQLTSDKVLDCTVSVKNSISKTNKQTQRAQRRPQKKGL